MCLALVLSPFSPQPPPFPAEPSDFINNKLLKCYPRSGAHGQGHIIPPPQASHWL